MTFELSTLVTDFFVVHLAAERNASQHTVYAYRDTMKLLLRFAADDRKRTIDRLTLEDLSAEVVLRFLSDLESRRRNSISTRNARLAAIHSFYRYVLSREPASASLCHRVLAIPFKRTLRSTPGYLNRQQIERLFNRIDRSTPAGERDYVLLVLLYDTGARVQEGLDMKPRDFQLTSPAFVRVTGKGGRQRLCPLLPQTARLVARFLKEHGRPLHDDGSLFRNRSGRKLSRHGVRYVLRKYSGSAGNSDLTQCSLSPHTLRHSKAMHLLQSGVALVTIKDVLGHADIKSTQVYVEADLEMKRKALERLGPSSGRRRKARIAPTLLTWLESL